MNPYYDNRSSRPARLFSFGLLDVLLRVRLRRPHLREATAGFGLGRLATGSMDNPVYPPRMSRAVLALLIVALGLGLYLWLVEMPAEQKRVEADTTAKKL